MIGRSSMPWMLVFVCAGCQAAATEQSILEYGRQCAIEVGDIPPIDCTKGTDIPITVNGETPSTYPKGMTCDRPSLFSPNTPTQAQCAPHSKVLDLSRGPVQVSVYCRRTAVHSVDNAYFDAVDIVAHNTQTGKTCWFTANVPDAASSTDGATPNVKTTIKPVTRPASDDVSQTGVDASKVPSPTMLQSVDDKRKVTAFWNTPSATAGKHCVTCHDAGPYIYSPFIGQVWAKVPSDPFGKYENIGRDFAWWPRTFSIKTAGNTCTGCHRIGNQESCQWYVPYSAGCLSAPGANDVGRRYPLDHWMPTNADAINPQTWDAANVKSVHDLLECCLDRDHKNPKCIYADITKGPTNDNWTRTGTRGAMATSAQCTSRPADLAP